MRLNTPIICAALTAATALHAQNFATHPCNGSGDGGFFGRMTSGEQACEVRSATFALIGGHLNVKGTNGGIEVVGEARPDVALEARVSARAGSQSEAAGILREITIETGSTVEAHGPKLGQGGGFGGLFGGNKNWTVSYRLRVPHHLAGYFQTVNGAISLASLEGNITGETTNGAVSFHHLAGDVHLSTTNGGIEAKLDGSRWQGGSLKATTTNGGISVHAAPDYSAHLVANTTNGGIEVNVAHLDGNGVHRHSVDTNIGSGGPTVQFSTTNGGISIN